MIVRLLALAFLLGAPYLPARAGGEAALSRVEETVREAFPDVVHLTPAEAERRLGQSAGDVVIFDVREADEWAVSHLAGAERVSPRSWRRDFPAAHGQRVAGKTVLFYCSVGVRSSKLAGRVQDALKAAGATAVYNLSGGAFRWHNEGRAMVDRSGMTPAVHPYDRFWGRYLARREAAHVLPIERPVSRSAPPPSTGAVK